MRVLTVQNVEVAKAVCRNLRLHWGLGVVVVAFLIAGTVYSLVTPIFEASDEFRHYAFVQHLADGKGLPILDTSLEQHQVRQEVAQPPLYYALAAPIAVLSSANQDLATWHQNPHALIGVPMRDALNRNAFVHSDAEAFPWQGTVLAVHLIRLISLLMGAVVVVAAYLLALKIRPNDQ